MAANSEQMTDNNPFRDLWELGYRRLVPVIPPDAELSERSSIAARARAGQDPRGKSPGVKRKDGTWIGMQFVAMESQESDLDAWQQMGASVGVKTGQGLIAVDIDTKDRRAAERIYKLAAETLGPASVRFGQKPKCLLLYEAPEETPYRRVSFSTDTEDKAAVEILSEGRQFVARGVHPKTGNEYAWPAGTPRRDALSRITADQLDTFMQAVADALPGASLHTSASDREAPDQETLQAPSWDRLKETVEAIPNISALFENRDDYVKMAYAIKGATPDGYEHEALELYLDWCDRWQDGTNDPDIALKDWMRAKPPFRVGFNFLTKHATGLFFEQVSVDPLQDMFEANTEAVEGSKQQGTYELLRVGDILNLPDPTFAIDRHIPEASMGFLYGRPGCGKSFIALDWALHMAYGLSDWHGDALRTRPNANVLYLAREGSTGFKARIRAWQQKHLTPEGKDPNFALIRQTINFMQPDDIAKIVKTCRDALDGPVDLIVVDTVSRVLPGADENLQKEMTLFVRACDALQDAFKAIILGVHHSGKSGDMRGSSVLKGAGDFVFKLERKEGARTGQLICEKQKDAPDGWHERYAFPQVEFDGGSSLVPERAESAGADGVEPGWTCGDALKQDILAAMQAAWDAGKPWSPAPQARDRYAVRLIVQAYDVKGDVAETWLEAWVEAGEVVVDTRDGHSKTKGYRPASLAGASVFD